MRSTKTSLTIVITALFVAGCAQPTADSVVQKHAKLLEQVAAELESVKSAADADRVAAHVRKLALSASSIAAEARRVEESGKVSQAEKDQAAKATTRLKDSLTRLQDQQLITPELANSLEQLQLAQATVIASMGIGTLPEPTTPLEEAWVQLIQADEELAQILGKIRTASGADNSLDAILASARKKQQALVALAKLGSPEPPQGVPEKYKQHYRAAESLVRQHDLAVTSLLGEEAAKALAAKIEAAKQSDPLFTEDPFRLSTEIRAAGDSRVTVLLKNNRALAGPRHQQMVERLRQAAGADHCEAVIDGESYRVVLAPVADLNRFIAAIDFGTVTDRNDTERSFTLTINPDAFPAGSTTDSSPLQTPSPGSGFAAGPFGFAERLRAERSIFERQNGGAQQCATIALVGDAIADTRHEELTSHLKAATGAQGTMQLSLDGKAYILLGGISDLDAVAKAIDFGKVQSIDRAERMITVFVDNK